MKYFLSSIFSLIFLIINAQSPEIIADLERKVYDNSSQFDTEDLMQLPEIIDVTRYDLYFSLFPNQDTFSGNSHIFFTALDDIDEVTFDAQSNLNITQLQVNSATHTDYTRAGNNITINLNQTLSTGESMVISVEFNSAYSQAASMYKEIQNGQPIISTLSEPFGASSWWIGKDNLKDKADLVNIYVSHPSNLKVGSNGTLISSVSQGNNVTFTHWQHNYPIPAYLISLAMTNYVEYNNSVTVSGTTFPIINYVYPSELNAESRAQLDAVPYFIEFFSDLVGDYPYKNEKYGHCQWNWGGGMEHATMSSQINFGTSLTAHELAHQWFGDKITCGTWSDIWLNEGFATYFEGLLRRNLYGEEFFTEWKQNRANYVMSEFDGSVYIPTNQATSSSRIFDARLSYYKGAMVLHMLRYTLGDQDFYQAIRNYLLDENLAYKFAITDDLQEHFEMQSGMDLDEFFADWIYGEGFPIFSIHLDYQQADNSAILNIQQASSHNSVDFFETKFNVLFVGTNGQTELREFNLTENNQNFIIEPLPFALSYYVFNPYADILGYVNNQTLNTLNLPIDSNLELKLYPNPATNFIYILNPVKINSIQIFDSQGKLVSQKEINDSEADIFIQNLVAGSYILKANTINGVSTVKFIKK